MRRCFQQIGSKLVGRNAATLGGWLMGAIALAVYLITLEPNISFWDCGEFIATSATLQIGHPPGAPFYQLLAHCFTLLAFGNPYRIAWWSNCLSAVAGGATIMFMFWTIVRICRCFAPENKNKQWPSLLAATIGSAAFMVCDTAWFSAVESEVYSLSMCFSSAILWAMMRWAQCEDRSYAHRWLLLVALLLGLSVCVHLLTLLVTPALLLIYIFAKRNEWKELFRMLPLAVLLFAIGLTPYLIIPIRANANPPINEGNPSTAENFKRYITREQYEHAPLFPRMWRQHPNDSLYYADWSRNFGELELYTTYQLGYMYTRYFMWNFVGRYNDRQGFGSPQNGQFITGIPIFDKLLVGESGRPPKGTTGHHKYFFLPLILGIWGCFYHQKRHNKGFWMVLTLFLVSGVILNFYLNHPAYEPRERDYAYVLSFYAFCLWIGIGAQAAAERWKQWAAITLAVPLLMACQNWKDHDRSGRMVPHDIACNMLNSCDKDAILFSLGDNDTFPLWGVQYTEGERTDVSVQNINLMGGFRAMLCMMQENPQRPIYLTQYAYDKYRPFFEGRLQLEGFTYRLMETRCDSVSVEAFCRHITEGIKWHDMANVYVDEISARMLRQYEKNLATLQENLNSEDTFRVEYPRYPRVKKSEQ